MSKVQTDNSHFEEKVCLRIDTINQLGKDSVTVFEAFSGDGLIWSEIKRRLPEKDIKVLRVDQKENKRGVYLKGDNLKFMGSIGLTYFDIIDLDAYGDPTKQLSQVFKQQYKGIVHVTFIQTGMGRISNDMLLACGFTKEMVKKCPTMFSKGGIDRMKTYLAANGVSEITGHFVGRKNYFYFNLDK